MANHTNFRVDPRLALLLGVIARPTKPEMSHSNAPQFRHWNEG